MPLKFILQSVLVSSYLKMLRTSEQKNEHSYPLMKKIDEKVSQVLEVNNHLPLPLGFSSVLYETFECSICHESPIITPAMFGKRIVGCQQCIDTWCRGEDQMTKRCPLCHGERGFADSMILSGLSSFEILNE